MWNNIGNKIKAVAKIFFWVASGILVVTSIILLAIDRYTWWIWLIAMFLSPIIVWLSSLVLYAFGELVQNSTVLANNVTPKDKPNEVDEKLEKKKRLEKLFAQGLISEEEYNIGLSKL